MVVPRRGGRGRRILHRIMMTLSITAIRRKDILLDLIRSQCQYQSLWDKTHEMAHNHRRYSRGYSDHMHDRSNVTCWWHGISFQNVEENRIVVSKHRIYRARLYIYPSPHRNALGLWWRCTVCWWYQFDSKKLAPKTSPAGMALILSMALRMMDTNHRKADQAIKAEPVFESILEQVLSLDTRKKVGESRSMKSASKAIEANKKLSSSTLSCLYCKKIRSHRRPMLSCTMSLFKFEEP